MTGADASVDGAVEVGPSRDGDGSETGGAEGTAVCGATDAVVGGGVVGSRSDGNQT